MRPENQLKIRKTYFGIIVRLVARGFEIRCPCYCFLLPIALYGHRPQKTEPSPSKSEIIGFGITAPFGGFRMLSLTEKIFQKKGKKVR